jgi:hypothetical protein
VTAGNGNGHGTEFAQDMLPLLDRGPFLSNRNFIKELMQAVLLMLRQF